MFTKKLNNKIRRIALNIVNIVNMTKSTTENKNLSGFLSTLHLEPIIGRACRLC